MFKSFRGMIPLLIVCSSVMGVGCSSKTSDSVSDVTLDWKWLWDPEVEELPDWQIFDQPTHLVRGTQDELFLADDGNSRVIRLSLEGELIEVIGKEGAGPGEFLRPTYLSIERTSGELYVIDSQAGRISRFKVDRNHSEFIESYTSKIPQQLSEPSLIVNEDLSVWTTGYASSPRIRQMDLSGETFHSFGEPWIIEDLQPLFVDLLNRGLLVDIGNGHLGYLWRTKALLEIWSEQGQLVRETELLFPEVQELMDLEKDSDPADLGREWVPFYFHWATSIPSQDVLFVGVSPSSLEAPFAFYELSIPDLTVIRRYSCSETPEIYRIVSCIAEKTRTGYRFYALDRFNHGIAVLEPIDD